MKKALFITLLILTAGSVLAALLIFGGDPEKLKSWWEEYTHDSDSMPWCPYSSRLEKASKLHILEASGVAFTDGNLFWKGEGATAGPELGKNGNVLSIVITSSGSGYSRNTEAKVTGAGSEDFELGKVSVEDGKIKAVALLRAGTWYKTPRVHARGIDGRLEKLPFSGKSELKFDNGQIHERKEFLSGELHGEWERFRQDGIKVFSKEFQRGRKHGTHIYWFHHPTDPEDYKTQSDAHLKKKIYASLWVEVHEDARKKFSAYPSPKASAWILKEYESRGGSFQVKLLEHYEANLRHGLFEGFDHLGNQTFKDEYEHGHRLKHQIFDKVKKG